MSLFNSCFQDFYQNYSITILSCTVGLVSSRTGELETLAGEGQGESLHKSSPSEKDSKPEMELEVM